MAGVLFSTQTGAITMTASTALSHSQLNAASNHRVLVHQLDVSANSITAADAGVLVEIGVTTGGTFTSLTPRKLNSADDETLEATAGHTASGEPTYSYVLFSAYFQAQHGLTKYFDPPLPVPGGTSISVRLTPGALAATTKATTTLLCEE